PAEDGGLMRPGAGGAGPPKCPGNPREPCFNHRPGGFARVARAVGSINCRLWRDLLARVEAFMAAPTLPRDRPAFRAPLTAGDIAPSCALATPDGKSIDLGGDDIEGNTLVIAFWPRFDAYPVESPHAFLATEIHATIAER